MQGKHYVSTALCPKYPYHKSCDIACSAVTHCEMHYTHLSQSSHTWIWNDEDLAGCLAHRELQHDIRFFCSYLLSQLLCSGEVCSSTCTFGPACKTNYLCRSRCPHSLQLRHSLAPALEYLAHCCGCLGCRQTVIQPAKEKLPLPA